MLRLAGMAYQQQRRSLNRAAAFLFPRRGSCWRGLSRRRVRLPPGCGGGSCYNRRMRDVFDELGERLYIELRSLNAVSEREWGDLAEHEREFYRTAAEGLILDWDLMLRAHAQQIYPV